MAWLLPLLLVAPLGGAACLALGRSRWTPRVLLASCAAALALALALVARTLTGGAFTAAGGWLHVDGLVAMVAIIVTAIALPCAWYGSLYMPFVAERDHTDARWAPGRYEALLLGLLGCMLVATAANNLGLMWIAIEGATLASALLVGYYRRPGAVEAAWKYLVLCSVGISLALLATVLLYYSAGRLFGEEGAALQWTHLRDAAQQLDPRFVKLAFLFALAGYGAKAGLAPMHSWLPDAYSQAPTPVAALMSTALLATSLSALLRFFAITAACTGPAWPCGLFALFGALSMVMAVPFLLVQGEYKRLLAYSSIEHAGLVTLAIGFGTPLAVFGAFLGLFLRSFELNVFGQIGLVMLIGLAAKNAILIVEFAKAEHEKGKPLVEAALEGARLRLRPILMTSFAFILGCVPLAIASGAGAVSRQQMGIAVIMGMLVATLVGIFLVPVLFVVIERLGQRHAGGGQ